MNDCVETVPPLRLRLLALADAYAAARGLSRARVSTMFFGGGRVLDRIASEGTDITTGTLERAVAKFSDNWPDGVAWPEGLARPSFADAAVGNPRTSESVEAA